MIDRIDRDEPGGGADPADGGNRAAAASDEADGPPVGGCSRSRWASSR
jgi:hypothetical protein